MKISLAVMITFVMTLQTFAQLTKTNWLVGGTLSYSKSESKGTDALNNKFRSLNLSSNTGYFLWDKIALGLNINGEWAKEKNPQVNGTTNTIIHNKLGIGPFVRYYILNAENRVNILSEGAIAYSTVSNKTTETNFETWDYSFFAGPVFFFNSSVGLEMLIGYMGSQALNYDSKGNELKFKIGFQIHLEK